MLISAVEPVPPTLLAELLELPAERIEAIARELARGDEESAGSHAGRVTAGGYSTTRPHPDIAPFVERFAMEGISSRLSSAALEPSR